MQENKSIGPFKAMGLVLNTVGTAAGVLDDTVKTSGDVIHGGLKGVSIIVTAGSEAIDIIATGALEDLKADQIIEDAHRKVRTAKATTEAAAILAKLEETTKG